MDTNLLRGWLGLPPGPWPPDHYTLLGLPPGPADPADAERRALERMGRLRPHQLVHPDLVTEGMNRLAQAMLAVTSAGPVTTPPPAPPPPPPQSEDEYPDLAPAPPPPVPIPPPAPHSLTIPSPTVLAFDEEDRPESSFGGQDEEEFDPDKPTDLDLRPLRPPAVSPPRAVPVPPPPPPPPLAETEEMTALVVPDEVSLREGRRAAYRELAGLRSLLRAWDKLRPSAADPSAPLASPADVCEFLEAVTLFRQAARHPGVTARFVRESAPSLAALMSQPLPLAVLRSLTVSQRRVLARDWATGRGRLLSRAAGVRAAVGRAGRPAGLGRDGGWHILVRHPEWMLGVATGLVLLTAVVAVRLTGR